MVKHVSTVSFMEMESMQASDWEVLDFPALRPKARAKLVRQVISGSLEGFFRVGYDMHKRSHGGKPTYYFPASDRNMDAFLAGEYDESRFETFGGDYAEEVDEEFPEFDQPYARLEGAPDSGRERLARAVFVAVVANEDDEPQRYYVEPNFAGWQDWALSVYILTGMYKAEEEDRRSVAEEFGVPYNGQSVSELLDEIVEAMEEAGNEGIP